jgi:glycosyltransferase involved in cell wall biosynthesis
MIVKNEEAKLEKCLEALKPLRENLETELIIADTGSSDKTPEIAEKYADKVLHIEWKDDFSAARNAVLREAKGEWYMTIDADEVLLDFVPLKEFLFGNPLRDNYSMASVIQRNYKDNGSFSDFNAVRLAKVTPSLSYEGKIHEAFNSRGSLFMTGAVLNHYGYAESNNKGGERYERNISLLKSELEANPENPLVMKQLYDSYVPIDKDEAIKWLEKCRIAAVSQNDDKLILAAFAKECVFYAVQNNTNKIINLYEEYKKLSLGLTKKYGHYALEMDIFAAAGLALCAAKRYAEAEKCFAAYVEITDLYENGEMKTAELFVEEPTFPKSSDNYVNILKKYRETLISLKKTAEAAIMDKRIVNPNWDGTVVTIGMIVKNEEKVLERCLQGLQPIRDAMKSELIIVDTGSTDKTVEIAEKYGAKMLYFDWIGDFSAARNVGLRAAKGEWFMFIDADEHLVDAGNIATFFLDTEFNKDFNSASYIVKNLDGDNYIGDFRALRIARNYKGLRFHKKVHEQFDLPYFQSAMIETYAEHRSYGKKLNEEQGGVRYKRNIDILEKEIADNPDSTITMRHLFDAYKATGEMDKALEWLQKGLDKAIETKNGVMIITLFATIMIHNLLNNKSDEIIEQFKQYSSIKITNVPRKFGHYAAEIDIYGSAAAAYYAKGNYAEAVKLYKEYIAMTDKYDEGELTTFDAAAYVVFLDKQKKDTYKNTLGFYFDSLRRLGRLKDAEKIYRRKILLDNPDWDETILTIGMIVKNEEKHLEKCLLSLDHLRRVIKCQLIIVDTGSIDKTVEIASKYADEVRHFTWINDFAAARNESMRGAKGNWFMFIDADEYFENTKEIEKFFRDGEYLLYNFASYIQRNYVGENVYSDFFAPRMTKLLPGQRFFKSVHESLNLIEPVKYFRDYVHHYGYKGEAGQKKVLRNMEMLLDQHREHPEDVIVLEQLATAYAGRDDQKMIECYREGIRITKAAKHIPLLLVFYARLIRWYATHDLSEEAYELGKEIVPERFASDKLSPSDLDIFGFFAFSCHKTGRYEEAEKSFKVYTEYYEAYKQGKLDGPMLMVHTPDSVQPDVYSRMLLDYADTLISLEKWEEAYKISEIAEEADNNASYAVNPIIQRLKIVQRLLLMRRLSNYEKLSEFIRHFASEKTSEEIRFYLIGALKNELKETSDKNAYLKILRSICREGFKYNLPHDFCALINLIGLEEKSEISEQAFIKATDLVREITGTGAELTLTVMRNGLSFDLVSKFIDPENAENIYVNLYAYEESFADDFTAYVSTGLTENCDARSKLILIKMAEASLKVMKDDVTITDTDEIFRQCLAVVTDGYLKEVYEPEIISEENSEHMPGSVRAAYYILMGYIVLSEKDYKAYIKTLRGVISAEPALKNYVSALTQKVRMLI